MFFLPRYLTIMFTFGWQVAVFGDCFINGEFVAFTTLGYVDMVMAREANVHKLVVPLANAQSAKAAEKEVAEDNKYANTHPVEIVGVRTMWDAIQVVFPASRGVLGLASATRAATGASTTAADDGNINLPTSSSSTSITTTNREEKEQEGEEVQSGPHAGSLFGSIGSLLYNVSG